MRQKHSDKPDFSILYKTDAWYQIWAQLNFEQFAKYKQQQKERFQDKENREPGEEEVEYVEQSVHTQYSRGRKFAAAADEEDIDFEADLVKDLELTPHEQAENLKRDQNIRRMLAE